MFKHLTCILLQDAMILWLYYIRFIVAFDKFVLGMCILLNKYFFVNRDFGPFMPQIYKAYNMLLNSPVVIIHFFILGTEWLDGYIISLNASL